MSIRIRIALLSAILITLLLMVVGAGVYFMLQRWMEHEIDDRLVSVEREVRDSAFELQEGRIVAVQFQRYLYAFASPGLYIQVLDSQGALEMQEPPISTYANQSVYFPPPASVHELNQNGQRVFYTQKFPSIDLGSTELRDVPMRVVSVPVIHRPTNTFVGTLQVAEPLTTMRETMERLRNLLLVGLGGGFLVTLFGSYILAGRSLSPLARITSTARTIGDSGDLSERIELPQTHDEVHDLAQTFNAMLARLDDAFSAERRFVSDASHELRTPLTAIRGNAEILLRQVETDHLDRDDVTEILTDIRDEAERMGRLVQNLLTLARADVGWRPDLETVQLDLIVNDVARLAAPLARNHRFIVQVDEEVDAVGNADQLRQLLLILLDNAFNFTPRNGEVELQVRRIEDQPEIVVRDSGPGMPEEQLARIYDRFYRGEAAREGRTAGAGLGLSIARWIVECHRGDIRATSGPNEGTEIMVRLRPPAQDEPALAAPIAASTSSPPAAASSAVEN